MNSVKSNGASSTLFQHDRPNKPNRSKFDLSRITNFSIDTGMIAPFDCFPTLPGDIVNLDVEMALDTLPLVQSSLTNYKVTVHWYYMKSRDLWKGFKTFITKGRTGNVNLTIPKVDLYRPINNTEEKLHCVASADENSYLTGDYYPLGQHSLGSFLGVPSFISGEYNLVKNGSKYSGNIRKAYLPHTFMATGQMNMGENAWRWYNDATKTGFGNYHLVNALPFMMYQSIVKNNYVNQNLLQDNTALFPEEGDDDWLLPYTIENNECNYVSGKYKLDSDDVVNYSGVYSSDETEVDLRLLRYAMFDDDYFTTGLPWLQRGNADSLSFEVDMSSIPFNAITTGLSDGDGVTRSDVKFIDGRPWNRATIEPNGQTDFYAKSDDIAYGDDDVEYTGNFLTSFTNSAELLKKLKFQTSVTAQGKIGSTLNANMLRNLLAMSVWQERNARVDGSYNRMIFQHWSQNPHSEEHKPVYIGGTASYMNFSTVLQQSQTTDDSALGSTAGFGQSSGRSSIGSFRCDDYGYIMGVMIIKPNTTYQQGVERFLSCENVFDDFVQPEFEGLSPQPILNKELYATSNEAVGDDLFCYQERNTSYKVRQNVNKGLFQCKPDKDILFGAFTQARWFDSMPKFSYQFVCMSPENIRRDWLSYPVYPAFRCQLLTKAFVVRNLSYSSQPNTFGF